jgi:hypothetical protein
MAWMMRHQPQIGVPSDPLMQLIAPLVIVATPSILYALIYYYVPRRLDEVLHVLLLIVVLFLLIAPSIFCAYR